jgi:hypothetical protein
MTLSVTASDGYASASAVMFISAFCDSVSACETAPAPTPEIPQTSIPMLWAMVCVDFSFNVAEYFHQVQTSLQFSMLGLPYGSGLQIDAVGRIHGVPTRVDCSQSPLSLTVVARDAIGREFKAILYIKFRSCECQQPQLPPPSPRPFPVEVRVPYPVEVRVPYPVNVPYPVEVGIPVPVEVVVPYPVNVPVEVVVDRPVRVPYPVEVQIDVPYPYPWKFKFL